jgi:hypothetical protein
MPQIALRPFMAAVMRAAARAVKPPSPPGHDLAATWPGIVPKQADFSRLGARACRTPVLVEPMNLSPR